MAFSAAILVMLIGLFYFIRASLVYVWGADGYRSYSEVLQTVETAVEIVILLFIIIEGSEAFEKLRAIYDSTVEPTIKHPQRG